MTTQTPEVTASHDWHVVAHVPIPADQAEQIAKARRMVTSDTTTAEVVGVICTRCSRPYGDAVDTPCVD